ncbi:PLASMODESMATA CALLOSE-BINDING PROTEIN 3-like, partial [Olea europaea subsp. europaea]
MAAPPSTVVVALLFLLCTTSITNRAPLSMVEATWCVVRSDASEQAMLAGLNFACAAGADCAAIQSSGLCYLPNTIQAHASYAYNSYYQRRGSDSASCYFFGTATIAKTDPSYGSCVYPSSPRFRSIILSHVNGNPIALRSKKSVINSCSVGLKRKLGGIENAILECLRRVEQTRNCGNSNS